MTPGFWRGKRVFITGHTGFKGSWLCLWLQSLGAEVTGYSLGSISKANLFQVANVASGVKSVVGDIRELGALQRAMRSADPAIVIHLAAQALVRTSYQNPVETYSTNVMGTVNVLECVRRCQNVRAVLNVTTDKCYENRGWVWGYRENEPLGGFDPYSSSKSCSELVSAAYRTSFFSANEYGQHGVAVATARSGNVLGGGDWAEARLVPDIVAAFETGATARLRNPHAIRPWQHVLESLFGYLTLLEMLHEKGPEYAEAWNFGPEDRGAKTVSWIADQLAELWGGLAHWEVDPSPHPHEADYLRLDSSKSRSRLNWYSALDLRQSLGLVVDWAKANAVGSDMRTHTISQIKAYEDLLP